ncbi:MAG: peptidase S41 [Rikenellaceae bacterium]|nr:peptidase S41 [Rikenellaceae bacterium]
MKRLMLFVLAMVASTMAMASPLWLRYPAISPDGSTIAFTYKGDIWLVGVQGGESRQLTTNQAYDYAPIWSPDGKTIAFASDRFGNFDIYTVPVKGGIPTRITTHSGSERPWTFTPDGKQVVFTARIQDPAASVLFPKGSMTELYAVGIQGGRPQQLLATPAEEVDYLGLGDSFVYQDKKGGENIWRKHHTSSITRDLWLYRDGKHTQLTDFAGEDRNPRLSADGKTVYYLSEREGSFNVYSFPLDAPKKITRVTNHKIHPVRFLSVAKNGTLCYAYDGNIYVKEGSGTARKLSVSITADYSAEDQLTMGVKGFGSTTISPDGSQMAFVSRGEVFVASVEYGTTKQITKTPEAEADVTFSPNGRTLAYASDREGKWNIYTAKLARKEDINFPNATLIEEKALFKKSNLDRRAPQYSPDGKELAFIEGRDKLKVLTLATGKVRQITDGSTWYSNGGKFHYSWSPDGKWFALDYVGNRHNPYTDIGIVKASGGEPIINLTNSGYFDNGHRWVLDGNAILFNTDRYGMRSHASWGSLRDAMIIFLNRDAYDRFMMNKEERALLKANEKLTQKTGADEAENKTVSKDIVVELRNIEDRIVRLTPSSSQLGSVILDKTGANLYYVCSYEGPMKLWKLDVKKKTPTPVGKASGTLVWDKKMSTLFVLGGNPSKLKLKSSSKTLAPIKVNAEMVIDRVAEREYMFDHVYWEEKNCFYNEKMHGVNWEMYRDAYRKFLPHINNNYDFAELLSEWLGELNVSHTGASYSAKARVGRTVTAELGLFFDLTWKGDGLKVEEIVEQGPFDKAASEVEVGDIVEQIDGVKITAGMDYFPLLNRKVGQRTLVTIRKASGGTIEEVVKPISSGKLNALLYKRFIKRAAETVERLSGGRLGYVHIQGMNDASFRTVYADILGRYNHCEGMVIDTRFNGGGRLHEDIEVLFSGKKYLVQEMRGKDACDMPSRRYNKPSIMVMGEANYSNAHGTPWVYKHMGIGKLVGMPVPGTMTSVNWRKLQDASLTFGIPVTGYRVEDGTYLENKQLEPDIKVANSKELVVTGRDEQLEVAVKALLEQIDAKKVKR